LELNKTYKLKEKEFPTKYLKSIKKRFKYKFDNYDLYFNN